MFKKEDKVVGQRPVDMNEVIEGTSGPAAVIYYTASDRGAAHPLFKDTFGRPGNTFDMQLIVPLELGNEISANLRADPKLIRDLIAELVAQKYPQEYQEAWNRYSGPPYEKWDANGGKFYVADLIKNPGDRQIPLDQNIQKNVISST